MLFWGPLLYAEIYIEKEKKKTRKDIKLLSEDPSQTSGPTDEEQNGQME